MRQCRQPFGVRHKSFETFGLDCNEISAVRSHCIPGVQLGQALALWLKLPHTSAWPTSDPYDTRAGNGG